MVLMNARAEAYSDSRKVGDLVRGWGASVGESNVPRILSGWIRSFLFCHTMVTGDALSPMQTGSQSYRDASARETAEVSVASTVSSRYLKYVRSPSSAFEAESA